MKFYLNELSLHNQYSSKYDFLPSLKEILKCKQAINKSGYPFYCSKIVLQQKVFQNNTFMQAVLTGDDKNIKRLVMIWISKDGPFWDDSRFRLHAPDDYLECNGQIVTDLALGEAAFQNFNNQDSCSISYSPSNYQVTPIIVTWHKENAQESVEVLNLWEFKTVEDLLPQLKPVLSSWDDFTKKVKTEYTNLYFLDSFEERLQGLSFNLTIAERALELLNILNTLKTCFDDEGRRTSEGHEVIEKYFQGERALFSDESNTNKNDFKKEMTFPAPGGTEIFCSHHGKILHRIFRLHFSWPVRKDEPLYIAYLGPKITKK